MDSHKPWLVIQFAVTNGTLFVLVAVSTTSKFRKIYLRWL